MHWVIVQSSAHGGGGGLFDPILYKILNESFTGSFNYSNPEENEKIIERFLGEHKEFAAVDFAVGDIRSEGGSLTLLPHIHCTDGFFIAKLKKTK